ncbi:TetR/AcrR family transcriptional regulator [uncultured Sphingomonas sp.]|uniref:TetR/AcrR family transcriptional regulator n=1 Tax=uncultured Sphingomonas sp. TaxID=158754 RepID=UPI0035C9BD83
MELFWRHGYEGVSISDLTDAIGIAPPSLYAAFGSKARLYQEALDRYAVGALDLSVLDQATDLRDGVAAILAAAIGSVHAKGQACMISTGMLASDRAHDALACDLADRRQRFGHLLQERLERWVPAAEAASLARYIVAIMQGISVHARDGATLSELESIANYAKAALPAC